MRNHFQAHHAAFRPTDQLDHFVQAPADHIDHLFVGLGHADDLVGRCHLLGFVSRACRHQTYDLHLVIVALQDGTDAFQGQTHIDIEIFRVIWRQIIGVRVVGHRKGVDVGLEDILGTGLVQACQLVFVALGQQFLNGLGLFAGDLQAQHFVLDAFAPQVVQGCGAGQPRGVLAVYQKGFFLGEIEFVDALVQLTQREVQTRFDAVQVTLVDGEAGLQVAALEEVVELGLPLVELSDIAGQEVAARGVQQLEVAVVDDHRASVVQRRLAVVMALEQLDDVKAGNHLIAIRLKVVPAIGCERIGRHRREAETNEKSEGGAGEQMLHADSTRGQLITHIRPSLREPVPYGPVA